MIEEYLTAAYSITFYKNFSTKLWRLLKEKHEKLKLVIKQDQANAPSMSAAVSSAISNNCDTYDCIGIQ